MTQVLREIQEENNWRDGDFAKFKVNGNRVDEELWCRMCMPMVYAHWEGFVVSALKLLIGYLNKLELEPQAVNTNLIVLCLDQKYKKLSGKQSFTQRVEFTDEFINLYNNNMKFSKKINTRSNLKSDVLEEICEIFGFGFEDFKKYLPDLDRLVNIRNAIAHGENAIVPTVDNLHKYIEVVSGLMDVFIQEIKNFLENEKYLMRANS